MKELKKFERGAEKNRNTDLLKLAFFDVDLKNSELLWSVDSFDQKIFDDSFIVKSGEWKVEDGWVVGKNPKMCPGMIISKDDF